ncbi:unnamed protein product [Bemisia tabaci]|uniref:Uncharacterized protein n=1 Tax=Bemisia tabaci TaxID=7038 RepID=A0A9P0AK39_BEMTA|nr:unnamed protein product [Bemisia tabaci]
MSGEYKVSLLFGLVLLALCVAPSLQEEYGDYERDAEDEWSLQAKDNILEDDDQRAKAQEQPEVNPEKPLEVPGSSAEPEKFTDPPKPGAQEPKPTEEPSKTPEKPEAGKIEKPEKPEDEKNKPEKPEDEKNKPEKPEDEKNKPEKPEDEKNKPEKPEDEKNKPEKPEDEKNNPENPENEFEDADSDNAVLPPGLGLCPFLRVLEHMMDALGLLCRSHRQMMMGNPMMMNFPPMMSRPPEHRGTLFIFGPMPRSGLTRIIMPLPMLPSPQSPTPSDYPHHRVKRYY